MRILGIDSATLAAGVALYSDGEVRASRSLRVTTHSDALLQLISDVLAEADVKPGDLDAIACGAGPGSFTGLRIGLATAKGLCLALERPLAMVSSLAALAARAPDGEVLAILDAHKGEVYAARFHVEEGTPFLQGSEEALAPEALATRIAAMTPLILVGDGAARYPELGALPGVTWHADIQSPRGDEIARLGAARLQRGERDSLASAAPHYIRASEAEIMRAAKMQQQKGNS